MNLLSLKQDSGPVALGHKVDTLVSLGHRGFISGSLVCQDSELLDLGQDGFWPTTTGLDLDLALARVDAALVGFVVARVDLAVTKFDLGVGEVGPARVWVERCANHIASVTAWLAAIVVRIDLAIVVGDLAAG